MNRPIKIYLLVGATLIAYIVAASFYGEKVNTINFVDFSTMFNRVYIGIVLCTLLSLVLLSKLNSSDISAGTLWNWTTGFASVLLISVLTTYYANPHNRFTTQRYLFTTPAARHTKSALYEKIGYHAQLIIMGTSRAFTLSPEYIYKKTGYKTFNFSVEGARAIDYFWQLEYILHQPTKPPQVLLIEIGPPSIPSGLTPPNVAQLTFSFQPLSILPYLSSNQQKEVILAYGEDVLSTQSFSDSLYLITHPNLTPALQTWTFQENGYAIRRSITHEIYLDLLETDIKDLKVETEYFCAGQQSEGKQIIKQLLSNAEEHHVGVVLYQSPVNGTVLQKTFMENEKFFRCQELLTKFMNTLSNEHKNVWYVNLIDYEPITDMNEDGFYDTRHLKPNASQAVIDQLIPSIQSAVQWSEKQKNKGLP